MISRFSQGDYRSAAAAIAGVLARSLFCNFSGVEGSNGLVHVVDLIVTDAFNENKRVFSNSGPHGPKMGTFVYARGGRHSSGDSNATRPFRAM